METSDEFLKSLLCVQDLNDNASVIDQCSEIKIEEEKDELGPILDIMPNYRPRCHTWPRHHYIETQSITRVNEGGHSRKYRPALASCKVA